MARSLKVVRGDLHAELRGKCVGTFRVRHRGNYLLRMQQVVFQECLQQNAPHLTRAQHGNLDARHGRGYLLQFVRRFFFVHAM